MPMPRPLAHMYKCVHICMYKCVEIHIVLGEWELLGMLRQSPCGSIIASEIC